MFHQADDIHLFLSPFDLSEVSTKAPATAAPMGADDLARLVVASFADRGDDAAAAFLAKHGLSADDTEELTLLIATCAAGPVAAYDTGMTAFKNGQIGAAVQTFAVLAVYGPLRAPALTGLAACACFQKDYDAALLFALESITCKENHPRTHLIAGYSALKAGDKKTAKRQLALATRLARGAPLYRDEQRCAQRELLLMQLSS
ncbi:hypothetical protein [Yoonia sp. BS5-3]|uniref:Tetratricopeptide repeat protein n=1 Tax=Yoonia phaeophyticola TaxID=3137369 RepID=A0ABZ2V447_9RHOB